LEDSNYNVRMDNPYQEDPLLTKFAIGIANTMKLDSESSEDEELQIFNK
jgi:hypothetical protein